MPSASLPVIVSAVFGVLVGPNAAAFNFSPMPPAFRWKNGEPDTSKFSRKYDVETWSSSREQTEQSATHDTVETVEHDWFVRATESEIAKFGEFLRQM